MSLVEDLDWALIGRIWAVLVGTTLIVEIIRAVRDRIWPKI